MVAIPDRRRFRFSLRTMFVALTVVAVWLGWNVSLVRQRRELLAELQAGECFTIPGPVSVAAGQLTDRDPINKNPHPYSIPQFWTDDAYATAAVGHYAAFSRYEPSAGSSVSMLRRWLGDEHRIVIAY